MPPAMKTPPWASKLSAKLPANSPRSAQKVSSAARLTGQLPAMPARVIAAALHSGTVRDFEQSNRLIEIFQAVAGECAFGRDVAEFVPQLLDNRVLER